MSKAELEQLEREAEQARSRLLGGLERLRSNDQLAEIKQRVTADVSQAKSELIGNAKSAVRDRADGALSEIKARIAANPAAALAIGAGIAWRLYRHPPVTSVLVGAGLMSLLRTDPDRPGMGAGMAARASDFAGSARHRVEDWRARQSSGREGDGSESVGERIGALAETARERVTEFASEARDTATDAMTEARRAADRWTASGRRAVSGAMPDSDRDRVLMGAAAFAIAAAVGIAAQRRANEAQTEVEVRRLPPPPGYRSPEMERLWQRRRGRGHPEGWRGGSAISS